MFDIGHRAVYVGIHMPLKNKSHRHRHHKHRHHRSKENNTDHDASQGDSQTPLLSAQPPAKERRPSGETLNLNNIPVLYDSANDITEDLIYNQHAPMSIEINLVKWMLFCDEYSLNDAVSS